MAHSHSNSERLSDIGPQPMVNPDELRRHQRALRILIVALIPLAIWTVVGLIAFWPGDISRHVNSDVAGYSVPGVTYPTARITGIKEIACDGLSGSTPGVADARCADLTSQLLEGDDKGKVVTVPITAAIYSSGAKVGQDIKLVRVPPSGDQPAQYQFSDFERSTPLLVMALIFAVVVIVVARWRGFAALLGLGFAGFILVAFMFPALIAGSNPIMVGLIGSAAIMFVALYAAHGFSARTTTALVGTLFGLILIAVLGYAATKWSHLSGVAAEDDYVLAASAPDLKLTSVVICGIIVAGLGILNDVTITQASAVWELADQGASQQHLFSRAMRIGRDHIASTVYTIAFATAGASLGVFLLIKINNRPLLDVMLTERFAAEVLSILVGSIGLVLAVPLTTAVGVAVVRASRSGRPLMRQTGMARTDDSIHRQRPAAVKEQTTPKQPEGRAARPEPQEATTKLPRVGRSPQPGASNGGEPALVESQVKRRRLRRQAEDDFGDFTYLHEPIESEPKPPESRGRRAL
ncbi:MAG TPA: YibE/F family protein [Propionibacteriaceae bacterium]